jgi:predicted TIM-barrel fold metal-dependent hydrolase
MNLQVRETLADQKLAVVDCDIHPAQRTPTDLHPYLPARWREHMASFGAHLRHGLSGQLPYPRMVAGGMRVDAFPADGPPGCNLELMRAQHLDANGVEHGILISLSKGGLEERNLDFAAALSTAVNDWQIEAWVDKEPRLRAGIVVPQEDADFAVAEIERRAADRRFVQILISPRASDPLGHRRYWPIYAAAQACNLPIGLHVQGFSGGHASTASGWPTY